MLNFSIWLQDMSSSIILFCTLKNMVLNSLFPNLSVYIYIHTLNYFFTVCIKILNIIEQHVSQISVFSF